MIDAGIYGQFAPRVKSVQDYESEANANENAQLQNMLARQKGSEYLAGVQRQGQIRNALAGLGATATDEQRIATLRGTGLPEGFDQADKLETSIQTRNKSAADTSMSNAHAGLFGAQADAERLKTTRDTAAYLSQTLAPLKTPEDAVQWYEDAVRKKLLTTDQAVAEIDKMPQQSGPQWEAWKAGQQQAGLTMQQQAEQAMKATEEAGRNTRNDATNATSRANNANTQAGENARHGLTLAKDFKVAGIDPQSGNFVGTGGDGGMAGMVDALGQYKMNPSQAFARMQPSMRANVIAQVQQKYPDYDPTTYDAKTKAARDFTSGTQGNAMRSFAVAGQHLEQLDKLVDALNNKDTQLVNKIGNFIAEQTGNPAPTNFDAAKEIVGKEVIKAIVGSNGGVEERKELATLMSNAKSPAQLKGVIQQYLPLMAAQHEALLTQRRAAGLPDSTMPNYGGTSAAPALPPDIQAILRKHGAPGAH